MIKRLLASLFLLALGIAIGVGWFKFGPTYESKTVEQYVGAQPGDVVLPRPAPPFAGVIARTADRSKPSYPKPIQAPEGAPNVLLILTDDVGFAASSTFGGPVPTPNLDKLASRGLVYNRFHTTAICSPTRAAMLTGRNHHMVGNGTVTNLATGFPGYDGIIPKTAATIGRIMTENGFNTAFFGKHHNVPGSQASAAGPFDLWPTGLGFEYFYGFLDGDTDQFHPKLYRCTSPVEGPGHRRSGYLLDADLADEAIRWIHNQQAADPDKPFLVWYAPGTAHAPHQAPREWIARFRGDFDQGWDRLRQETFARQKAMGLIPQDTVLTPRPEILSAWDSLSDEEKRIDARFMEVFAATLAHQDAQIGRIFDELERMGELDDTLILFVEGDNGASAEGGHEGTLNEIGRLANGMTESQEWFQEMLDEMGGPLSYEVYPAGWAWALDTPFQWTKTVASHLGGTRNGLIVSWPARIKDVGTIRSQFHHVIDILPTVLEATGVQAPTVVDGIRQQRMDGISMVYSFDDASAEGRRKTQYFEIMGNRAIYHDGWLANTTPKVPPWAMEGPGGDVASSYHWELYEIENDYSQGRNLAAEYPEKLAEMEQLFLEEAERNNVFPLDDSRGPSRALRSRVAAALAAVPRNYVYRSNDVSVAESKAPPLFARDFRIAADVAIGEGERNGVLLAYGSWFGGWSFYLDDGVPVALHATSQKPDDQFTVVADRALPPGSATVEFVFDYDGGGLRRGGEMHILIDGEEAGAGRIERQTIVAAGLGETFDIGRDTGVPVARQPEGQVPFEGEIRRVEVEPGSLGLLPF
jgi:arylsulfatase A-like enzyme